MKKSIISLLLLSAGILHADFLPPSHELFVPLRADPRELQYKLQTVQPVGHNLLGEAAMGDYLGIYRRNVSEGKAYQVSIGGGVFGRFDLSGTSNEFEVVDYYGNVPFDYRSGRWCTRLLLYHTSSHLGDDFLKRTGQTAHKHTWDNLRWIETFDVSPLLRVYGGYTYVFRSVPRDIGRHALQGGAEMQSRWMNDGHVQFYWANDYQAWSRAEWNPMFTSQLGMTLANSQDHVRAVSFFTEYGSGRQPQGQFYRQQESHWNFGIRFQLS